MQGIGVDRMQGKVKIHDYALEDIEVTIEKKIYDYIYNYGQNPKYLKLPLWISECMKREMRKIPSYDGCLLKYRNLIICETISIKKLKEIEVF